LREWERDAEMKTALVKRQFVLDAFEAVSDEFEVVVGCGLTTIG
jgi:hypothetical protein